MSIDRDVLCNESTVARSALFSTTSTIPQYTLSVSLLFVHLSTTNRTIIKKKLDLSIFRIAQTNERTFNKILGILEIFTKYFSDLAKYNHKKKYYVLLPPLKV